MVFPNTSLADDERDPPFGGRTAGQWTDDDRSFVDAVTQFLSQGHLDYNRVGYRTVVVKSQSDATPGEVAMIDYSQTSSGAPYVRSAKAAAVTNTCEALGIYLEPVSAGEPARIAASGLVSALITGIGTGTIDAGTHRRSLTWDGTTGKLKAASGDDVVVAYGDVKGNVLFLAKGTGAGGAGGDFLPLSGGTLSGFLDMGGHSISNISDLSGSGGVIGIGTDLDMLARGVATSMATYYDSYRLPMTVSYWDASVPQEFSKTGYLQSSSAFVGSFERLLFWGFRMPYADTIGPAFGGFVQSIPAGGGAAHFAGGIMLPYCEDVPDNTSIPASHAVLFFDSGAGKWKFMLPDGTQETITSS